MTSHAESLRHLLRKEFGVEDGERRFADVAEVCAQLHLAPARTKDIYLALYIGATDFIQHRFRERLWAESDRSA